MRQETTTQKDIKMQYKTILKIWCTNQEVSCAISDLIGKAMPNEYEAGVGAADSVAGF